MNIIEALQALKEGKKIKRAAWKHLKYIVLMGNKIKDDLGGGFNLCVLSENLYEDDWELYAEPLKLTAEERKALELVKACGYDLILAFYGRVFAEKMKQGLQMMTSLLFEH